MYYANSNCLKSIKKSAETRWKILENVSKNVSFRRSALKL